ncbi:MAG: nuclear transport factor 2 family protein [Flavobacteriaceae bacterium]
MKKLILFMSIVLSSCAQTETNDEKKTENEATFQKNVAVFNDMIDAFAAENHEEFMQVFADSLKWSGPDKKIMGDFDSKEVLSAALKGYMAAYDNHALKNTRFFAGSTYSTLETSDDPNVIRVYGNWHHTHTASGIDVSHKWMALLWFNADGKIHQFNDFFDVGGFLVQHQK